METLKAIQSRHSYRGKFTSASVSREDMREILEAAVSAPSGCNLQTTEFIGVDDPAIARELGSYYGRAFRCSTNSTALPRTPPETLTTGAARSTLWSL